MASKDFYDSYRDLPFTVNPLGINLHLANVDPIALGLVEDPDKQLIKTATPARNIDYFEVIAAGPGYKSAFSGQFVENPCKVGDIVMVEQTNAPISYDGKKRVCVVGADKVLAVVTLKQAAVTAGKQAS